MNFDYNLHVFHSPQFQSVVDEALRFFNQTPEYQLHSLSSFIGAGVYALYYVGDFDLYAKIPQRNEKTANQPIYVGKAVPPGWRAARIQEMDAPVLYRRLREHSRSIDQANNLEVNDFRCRFIILEGVESDLVVPIEAELIRKHYPLWNSVIDGFGNHDPGSGRYNQAKSEWDVLHSGRPWADRLTGESPCLKEVTGKIQEALGGVS